MQGFWRLLTAFFDGEPFWMVRIRGLKYSDREYLNLYGNGHWRFLDREMAEAKFEELTILPRYHKESIAALESRRKNRERALDRVRQGKLTPFRTGNVKNTEKRDKNL